MCFLHKILVFSNDKKTMFIKKNQKSMLNKSEIAISVNSLDKGDSKQSSAKHR